MQIIGLFLLIVALPLLAERIRTERLKYRVRTAAAGSRSITPDDWDEFVGEWFVLTKEGEYGHRKN